MPEIGGSQGIPTRWRVRIRRYGRTHRRHIVLGALATVIAIGALATVLVASAAATAGTGRMVREFRVCSDPNNLPFSNQRGAGFENAIAELFARDLDATVSYEWLAQQRGFVRKTLRAEVCDVIMGVPARYDPVLTTKPYYRTTYVFVYRADDGPRVASFDDPALRRVKVGIHVIGDDYENTPPARALAVRGIINNVKGYRLVDDYSTPNPPSHIIDAVARGDIDVAIVYGPFAGYFAPRQPVKLAIAPVTPSVDTSSGMPFTFAIAMGVRHGDSARAAMLDSLIDRERPAIERLLDRYGIPLLSLDSVSRDTEVRE